MKRSYLFAGAVVLSALLAPESITAQSLRGSSSSLDRQQRQARVHDYTYLTNERHVNRFVNLGLLVKLTGNASYRVHNVSFPYVRPEVKTFVERLSRQYKSACGEQLVVTSATRPLNRQPRNASSRSVHPTGMAVDLRRSNDPTCRRWLEGTLLDLERAGLLEATKEHRPPHYHIAVFPSPYARYVQRRVEAERSRVLAHEVRKGDTLWDLARTHNTTVNDIKRHNQLRSSRIIPGQTLEIPATR